MTINSTPALGAVYARLQDLAATATAEELHHLGAALDRIGGRATLIELMQERDRIIAVFQDQESGTLTTVTAARNDALAAMTAAGNVKLAEILADKATWIIFSGTDGAVAGTTGIVPAPQPADQDKYLSAKGGWQDVVRVPIGGMAIIPERLRGTEWLKANGALALQADYPELLNVLGLYPDALLVENYSRVDPSAANGYSDDRCFGWPANLATGATARAAQVTNTAGDIVYTTNGASGWQMQTATGGAPGNSGNWGLTFSDTGGLVGTVGYDSSSTPAHCRARISLGTLGTLAFAQHAPTPTANGQYTTSRAVELIAQPTGLLLVGANHLNAKVFASYFGDGATAPVRFTDLVAVDPAAINYRGHLRIGGTVLVFADNTGAGSTRLILRTANNGETWTVVHSSAGTWLSEFQDRVGDPRNARLTRQVIGGRFIVPVGTTFMVSADGTTWTTYNFPASSGSLIDLWKVGSDWVGAFANGLWTSVDNLATWAQVATTAHLFAGEANVTLSRAMTDGLGHWGFHGRTATNSYHRFAYSKDLVTFRQADNELIGRTHAANLNGAGLMHDQGSLALGRTWDGGSMRTFLFDFKRGILYFYYAGNTAQFYDHHLMRFNGRYILHQAYSGNTGLICLAKPYSFDPALEFKLPTVYLSSSGSYYQVDGYINSPPTPYLSVRAK